MLENFSEALADIPEVVEAHLVTGDYDYLVKVAVKDADHYERFLRKNFIQLKEYATPVRPLPYALSNLLIQPI